MIQKLSSLSEKALSLTASDRAALAHVLIHSLDESIDEDIELAWQTEVSNRAKRLNSGETTERPAIDVLNEIRAKFS